MQVLDYMNRREQSAAIANGRLLYIKEGRVYFQLKDYRASDKLVITSRLTWSSYDVLTHVLLEAFKACALAAF